MATQQGVVKAFMKALDVHTLNRNDFNTDKAFSTKLLDIAIKACSSFGSVQEVINQMLADQKKAGNANTFLKKYCGINLDNTDTGAITGKDAGGSKVKTAKSIVPESGSLDEKFEKDYFTVNGLTVKLGQVNSKGDTVSRSFKTLSKQEKKIWRSLKSYWIKGGLNLIAESYGNNFSFTSKSSATTKTLYVVFADEGKGDSAATYGGPYKAQKSTNPLKLHINSYYYSNPKGADGIQDDDNKAKAKQTYLDRTVAHELCHSVMRSNIDYYDYLPAFIKEGVAELTHGIDDDSKSDLTKLAGDANSLKKSLVMNINSVDNVKGVESPSYSAGYIFMRYLAKQAATGGAHQYNKSVVGTSGKDSISNFISGSTIQALGGNDTVRNYASSVTIDGGAGNDRIFNEGSKVSIRGGNDADYIFNDSLASNVSIFGGDGADTIRNEGGNVMINCGNGNDSVRNDASFTVTILGGDGADHIANYGAAASIIGGNGNDSIWGDSGNDTLSGGSDNDRLFGDAGNDKIYGGTGNDTLWGGKDNDSLWGGAGSDMFIYNNGDGNDVIFGFDSNDLLQITGAFTTSYNKSKREIYFNVGSTAKAITIKDFGSTTTFHVNNETYQLSGSNFGKK